MVKSIKKKIKLVHKYILSEKEINQIKNYCQKNDIEILKMNDDHTDIFSEIGNLNKLFNLISSEFDFIQNVIGLDSIKLNNYLKIHKNAKTRINPKVSISNLFDYYKIPRDFNGNGQTIGIIELGGGYNINDLNTYFKNLGQTHIPTIKSVSIDGAQNNPSDTNSSIEVVLDIEIAGSIASASTIVVYFAPNTTVGFYDAIWYATNDTINNPSILSISWGFPEVLSYPGTLMAFDSLFSKAISKGMNIFVASGDNGSSDGIQNGNPHVDFPASSPNVIGCGGTTINNISDPNSETVWHNNTGSSGGGYSTVFSKPSYQLNNNSNQYRGVPDVCGNADPNTGYSIYINGQYIMVGGTSAVAPLWAGFTALLNQSNAGQSIGFLNIPFYQNQYILKDITIGNNDTVPNTNNLYNASKGWDPCTGLGSINGINIINRLVPPYKYGQ